ncbi:hypothetical protein [Pseudofrankia sp. DC12]|uniref:hypothetical protein n=1 Tax=Pseudofrankia sp. DC12 TaxID=683315 RepID=UPI000AE86DD8|nr:hypothetical protein [Pseudofrankia sp. DC12]
MTVHPAGTAPAPWQASVRVTCSCGRLDRTVTGTATARQLATGHDRAYHHATPIAVVHPAGR